MKTAEVWNNQMKHNYNSNMIQALSTVTIHVIPWSNHVIEVVTTLILFIVNDAFFLDDAFVRVFDAIVRVLDAFVFVLDDLVRIVGDDELVFVFDDFPFNDDDEVVPVVVPFSLCFRYFTSGVLLICTVVFNGRPFIVELEINFFKRSCRLISASKTS